MSLKKKTINKSESEDDSGSEHELFFYADNRFKLMQEVLKLIKPKVLQSMTPPCMKEFQLSTVKTMLLEELLGISAKRLRYMLEGVNMEVESSSESEQDIKPEIDIISLDDISDNSQISISDDENCMEIQLSQEEQLELDTETNEPTSKAITKNGKKSHATKAPGNKIKKKPKPKDKEPVMNVLNLLELQARARAIRSQLAVEVCKKEEPIVGTSVQETTQRNGSGDESSSESVIMISPQKTLIVIQDSDEETKASLKETEAVIVDIAMNPCENTIEEVTSLEKCDTTVDITDKIDAIIEQTNGTSEETEVVVEKTTEVLTGTTAEEHSELTNVTEPTEVLIDAAIEVVTEAAIEVT